MMATFEKKTTPRNCALNRLLRQKEDQEMELRIYKWLLIVICVAAFSNLMGWK